MQYARDPGLIIKETLCRHGKCVFMRTRVERPLMVVVAGGEGLGVGRPLSANYAGARAEEECRRVVARRMLTML